MSKFLQLKYDIIFSIQNDINNLVKFYTFLPLKGLITVTDPDGNVIQVAANAIPGKGGANMAGNSGIVCS